MRPSAVTGGQCYSRAAWQGGETPFSDHTHPVTHPAPDWSGKAAGAHKLVGEKDRSRMLTSARRESRIPNLVPWLVFAGLAVLLGRIIPALF